MQTAFRILTPRYHHHPRKVSCNNISVRCRLFLVNTNSNF